MASASLYAQRRPPNPGDAMYLTETKSGILVYYGLASNVHE